MNDKNKLKYLILGLSVQDFFWLKSNTPEQFNVMLRTWQQYYHQFLDMFIIKVKIYCISNLKCFQILLFKFKL